jgi:hypothetical protein
LVGGPVLFPRLEAKCVSKQRCLILAVSGVDLQILGVVQPLFERTVEYLKVVTIAWAVTAMIGILSDPFGQGQTILETKL